MKILLVNNQANPTSSGVASHFFSLSKQLALFGHEVIHFVAEDAIFKNKYGNTTYRYFKCIKETPDFLPADKKLRIKNNRKFFLDSLKKINCKSFDLAIVANDYYAPLLKKYVKRNKIVVIIPSSLGFSNKANPEACKKIILRMQKNLLGVKTVVLSKKMQSMLKKFLGKKFDISVVPPGVSLERFSDKKKKIKTDILYVGRIAEEKNLEAFIEALGAVKHNLKIKLVGSGNRLKELKQIARTLSTNKEFSFMGKKRKVERYYSESKIFVLPSKQEAFGLVILEAMAAGLPVIAFRPSKKYLTASDEIIDNGINGFLVKDTLEMAQKIDLLLDNKKLLSEMGHNALKKATEFSWPVHVKKLLALAEKD